MPFVLVRFNIFAGFLAVDGVEQRGCYAFWWTLSSALVAAICVCKVFYIIELWTVVAPRIGASEGKGTLSRPLGALERVPFQRMPFAKGARWLPLWPISKGHPSQGAPFRRPSRRAFSRSRPPPHPEQGAATCAPLTESGSCTGVRRFTQASTVELCVYGMETPRTPKKTPACPQNGPKAVLRWTQNGS